MKNRTTMTLEQAKETLIDYFPIGSCIYAVLIKRTPAGICHYRFFKIDGTIVLTFTRHISVVTDVRWNETTESIVLNYASPDDVITRLSERLYGDKHALKTVSIWTNY